MRRIIKEVFFEISNHKLISLMLGVQITLFTICLAILLFSRRTELASAKEKIDEFEKTGCYGLYDNLVEDAETEFFSNPEACLILKKFEAGLKEREDYGYCEVYTNPILMFSDKIPETALTQYESGDHANDIGMFNNEIACQVKNIFLDEEGVDSFIFNEEGYDTVVDCLYSQNPGEYDSPIVLGYDYRDSYEIGESIKILTPFSEEKEYTVAGFLEKGDSILYKSRFLNLDRYVLSLFPDDKKIATTEEENAKQRILYLMKINGQFITQESPADIQEYVNSLCLKTGLLPASTVSNSGNTQLTIAKAGMEKLMISISDISVLTGVFSLITVLLFVTLRISSNKRYYTILYLNGYSIYELIFIQVISFAFILTISNIISILVVYLMSMMGLPCTLKGMYFFLVDITATIIVSFVSYITMKRKNVADSLRGINDHSI